MSNRCPNCDGSGLRRNCIPCQCENGTGTGLRYSEPEAQNICPEINYPRISKPYWGGPSARRSPDPSRRGPWGARIQIAALAILATWLVYCLWYAGFF